VTELQQNRYDQLLRRVGDLKGPGSKVNDVLQELFPTLDVENVPGELLFLMGTRIGAAAIGKSPTAGKRAGIELFNPVGSGHLVTISNLWVTASSIVQWTFGLISSPLATNTGIPRLRDTRSGVNQTGVSELRTSPDTTGLSLGIFRALGNTTLNLIDVNSLAVLAPGTGFRVVGGVDDAMTATFFYRERIAEPSELNF